MIDSTNTVKKITLWNDFAERWIDEKKVFFFENLKIVYFGGFQLTSCFSTNFKLSPEIPEKKQLEEWYQKNEFQIDSFIESEDIYQLVPLNEISIENTKKKYTKSRMRWKNNINY